jgi:KipI family sensor histidine kinase inhibitor
MSLTVRPYGDRALLVEVGESQRVVAYLDALRARVGAGALGGVEDLVPAAETVLVVVRPELARSGDLAGLAAALAEVEPVGTDTDTHTDADARAGTDADADDVLTLPVRYDGPDLSDVARHTGLSEEEVVVAHTSQTWRVAFGGFAPGFGYLVGEDRRLRVPRRDSARTVVPAGAVGLAGEYSGVYPRESPGGWQIIGSTTEAMWDLERDPPALLRPGARVRFVQEDR